MNVSTVKLTEKELSEKFASHFSKWFEIFPEVKDDAKICRIDFLLQEKISKVIFGIECKHPGDHKGHPISDIVQQAIQYSRLKWDGKHIPIFIYPQLSLNQFAGVEKEVQIEGSRYVIDKHDHNHHHHTFNGFLGGFNVGEIRRLTSDYGPAYHAFVFNNQLIYSTEKRDYWNDIYGLHQNNYPILINRINKWGESCRIFKIGQGL